MHELGDERRGVSTRHGGGRVRAIGVGGGRRGGVGGAVHRERGWRESKERKILLYD